MESSLSLSPGAVLAARSAVDVGTVLHGVLRSLLEVAAVHPWTFSLCAVLAVAGIVSRTRTLLLSVAPRDPVRLFSRTDKAALLRQAGGRCEHHTLFGSRCPSTERPEADHVRPWSRGGRTVLANGQILCHRHNRQKNARVPSRREVGNLARRRGGYPAPGTGTELDPRPGGRTRQG